MKLYVRVICAVALALMAGSLLPAPTFAAAEVAHIRVAHTDPDAPPVDVYVNGSLAFKSAGFAEITQYASLPPGTYHIALFPTSANGTGTPILDVPALQLAAQTDYTAVAYGLLQPKPILRVLPFVDDNSMPPAGMARVRLIHASPDAPAIDLKLSGATSPITNVAPATASAYITVKPGTYQLLFTPSGSSNPLIAGSGVQIKAGTVYTIYAVGLLKGTGANALTALETVDASYPMTMPVTGQGSTSSTFFLPMPVIGVYIVMPALLVSLLCLLRLRASKKQPA